ncbi:hypothetical protein [Cellulomonas marina]|uniref:Uncharacterized protein n=1 Tax=Cellulomonas marina TaxID=988821 RepID=A0A1I0YAI1_9CELL|nr:hypothetical protein [Cellulomonas marina]GIG29625.1 hypothetical protein Cma02nite_22250 [Cellulomonas marina]SFB10405.1 hypothetical protein SAMN05421867_10718 [Cellulomonas marina]
MGDDLAHRTRDGDSSPLAATGDSDGGSTTVTGETGTPRDSVGRQRRFVDANALRALYESSPLTEDQAEAWKRDIRAAFDDELEDPYERERRRRG